MKTYIKKDNEAYKTIGEVAKELNLIDKKILIYGLNLTKCLKYTECLKHYRRSEI